MCRQCGLILCTLNPPHYACPHCTSVLGGQGGIGGEIGDLAEQVAREEARAAEGAFPMLLGSQAQMQMARTSHTPPPLRGATGGSELCDGGAGSGPAGGMCRPGM